MRLSRLIIAVVAVFAAAWLYKKFYLGIDAYDLTIFPIAISFATMYVFHHQVDQWYIEKWPPELDPKIQNVLEFKLTGYKGLSVENKRSLSQKIIKHEHSMDFIGMKVDDIPADLKYLVVACAYYFGDMDDSWHENYKRVALYKHPFLSPDQPDDIHICESEDEDGMLVFSVPHLIHGLDDSKQYLNIALYEYACIYIRKTGLISPLSAEEVWRRFEMNNIVHKKRFDEYFGLIEVLELALVFCYYINMPKRITALFPEMTKQFDHIGKNYQLEN